MKKDTIIIGTRSSKLALWQAEYVKSRLEEEYPELTVKLKLMTTKGDKILDAPLAKIGGKGLFTKELEMDMLEGGIDFHFQDGWLDTAERKNLLQLCYGHI